MTRVELATLDKIEQLGFNVKTPHGIYAGAVGNGSADDTAAIQAAIDAAEEATYGGIVFIPAGFYKISVPLTVKADNVSVVGAGHGYPTGGLVSGGGGTTKPLKGGTVIKPSATFVGNWVLDVCQVASPVVYALGGIRLEGFTIEGELLDNATSTVGGIHFCAQRSEIDNVLISRIPGHRCYVEAVDHSTAFPKCAYDNHVRGLLITNVDSATKGRHGLWFSDGATDNIIEGLIVRGTKTGYYGIYNEGSGNKYTGGLLELCDDYGVYNATSRDVKYTGVRVLDTFGGMYFDTPSANNGGAFTVTGCTLRTTSYGADNTRDAIIVSPAFSMRGGVITGNTFSVVNRNGAPDRPRYCINVATSNSVGLTVGPNSFGYEGTATAAWGTARINNQGTRTRLPVETIAQSAVAASVTGTLTETNLAAIMIPGGTLGANGRVRVTTLWSYTNSANTKNLRVRLGTAAGITGTAFLSFGPTTTAVLRDQREIANRNSQASQVGQPSGLTGGWGTATAAVTTGTVDTSVDSYINICGLLANTGETITLESYSVDLIPG